MRDKPSLSTAQKLVDKYNRQTAQIEALQTRLYLLGEKRNQTEKAAFAALPDGYGITLSSERPWEIAGPFAAREGTGNIEVRAAAMARRPVYTVRKQSSGRAASVGYFVFNTQDEQRVSVHASRRRDSAQHEADQLNIAALVLDHADDPRPYDLRRAEADAAYRTALKALSAGVSSSEPTKEGQP